MEGPGLEKLCGIPNSSEQDTFRQNILMLGVCVEIIHYEKDEKCVYITDYIL